MTKDKWTLIRVQNKNHLQTRWAFNPDMVIHLEDLDVVMVPHNRFKILEEREKKFFEIQELLERSPELVRDVKIVQAKLEYEKHITTL